MGQSKVKETRKQAGLAEARSDMYKFIASFYLSEPTEESVLKVANQRLVSQLSEVFSTMTVSPLKRLAKKIDGKFDDIKQDYHSLFLVPLDKFVTPYESVYREKAMHQSTTVQVKNEYIEASAVVDDKFSFNAPDYIGYELDFMRFLCESEAKAWQKDRKTIARKNQNFQNKFLKEHLSKWVPELAKNIEKNAETDYYKFVARITKQFVANDIKEVRLIMKESQ